MEPSEIVSAEYVMLPVKRPELFGPDRPWVVYYEGALRSNGKKVRCGMMSFKLKREAVRFAFAVCPDCSNDIPF